MSIRKLFILTVLCAAIASTASLHAQNVVLLPGESGLDPTVSVFSSEPLASGSSFAASPSAFLILPNPTGSKYYIVSRSVTDTLLVVDGSLSNVLNRFDVGVEARAAVLTPDGTRLLIAAGSLRVFNTAAADEVEIIPPAPIDVGTSPIDVAVSHDSKTAYVLSSAARRLTAINLSTLTVLGTVTIPGISTGVVVAPTGLIYVSAQNRIFEIDPQTITVRGEIPLNAQPGRLTFTPDGSHALAVNQSGGGESLLLLDIKTRTLASSFGYFGDVLDRVFITRDGVAYALSSLTRKLYRTTSWDPLKLDVASFSNLDSLVFSDVASAAASSELQDAEFLYVAAGANLYRVDLALNRVETDVEIANSGNVLSFVGPAATGTPADLIKYNNGQTVPPGEVSLPLALRVLDDSGKPLYNVPVSFSTATEGATLQVPTSRTGMNGLAQTTVIVPDTDVGVLVNAEVGSPAILTTEFTINAGSGVVGDSTGGLEIIKGQGQIVITFNMSTEPLTVQLKDSEGNPISGGTVDFVLTQGAGTLTVGPDGTSAAGPGGGLQVAMLTDEDGYASVNFLADNVSALVASFQHSTVRASTESGGVDFTLVSVPALLPSGAAAPPPLVTLVSPAIGNYLFTGGAGEVLPDAVVVRVTAQVGPQVGQPIPGVGVRLDSGLDQTLFPYAFCDGGIPLTGGDGFAHCDVVLGGTLGRGTTKVKVGGIREFSNIALNVLPGDPAVIVKLQGDNQTGDPGQQLPLALSARITDIYGNPLPGTQVQWQVVVPGTATLAQLTGVTDASARVSNVVTLAGTGGNVQVRLTAGAAEAIFNATVNVNVAQLVKASGDNQSAVIGQAFAQPIVVQALDDEGAPATGVQISFSVTSGPGQLAQTSVPTNEQGLASAQVQALGTTGPIVIAAGIGNMSVNFNLTSRLSGPQVTTASFRNGAGFQQGVTPGGVVTLFGAGLAPGIQGSVVPGTIVGPLPLSLADVQVTFGTIPAPIYSVNNINGQESVSVQAPFELQPGPVSVTVTVGGGSTTIDNVQVLPVQPGVFETLDSQGRQYAVLIRPNGSYVTPENPAARGEIIRMFATGLGQVSPATLTNAAGIPGQSVLVPVIIGVNDEGVRVVSAEYLVGAVGVYMVAFEVPADTTPGPARNFAIAVSPDGSTLVFGNGSSIPIQ